MNPAVGQSWKTMVAGAASGVVLAILCFATAISAVTISREGPLAGLAVLVMSPLYVLMYIVVFFKTLLPAGIITGIAAGAAAASRLVKAGRVLCAIIGTASGGFFGYRFTDLFLENADTTADRIVGGAAAAAFLALAGAALSGIIRKKMAPKTAILSKK